MKKMINNDNKNLSLKKSKKNKEASNIWRFIVVFLILCLLGYLMMNKNNKVEVIDNKGLSESTHILNKFKVDEKNTLITTAPLSQEAKELSSVNAIYMENNKTGKQKLVKKSDIQLSFVDFNGSMITKANGIPGNVFLVYEFTVGKTHDNKDREIKDFAYLYEINEGVLTEVYKTNYLFDRAIIENGNIVIYERLTKDDINMYPSYLKPYDKIKMVYENGKFIEKEREFIEPISELTKAKSSQ